ncbi:MAG: hypothetical protein K8R36_18600 [Planctomycetales bacterium]|nr:hypothetical protein [Planctomycetales bacterium]
MSRLSVFALAAVVAGLVLTTSLSAQGRGRGGGFGGGRGGAGPLMLVGNEAVQKEIGLTDDQKAKLTALREEIQKDQQEARGSAPAVNFQELSQEERTKLFAEMAATTKKLNDKYLPKLKETLKPEQFERVQQIAYQAAGPAAFTNDDVVKALDLTKEQQEKIATVNKDFQAKMQGLFTGGGAGGPEAFTKLRDEQSAELAKVLTKEQSEKWTALKGKTFDVASLGGGRGGPGGSGGRPGGRPGAKGGEKKKVD